MATFNFCPDSLVAVTLPRETQAGVSMNGWQFTARPNTPFQRRFKVMLHGLHWFLAGDGSYDAALKPTVNARALELFYQEHETWKPFTWFHPHLRANIECRFNLALSIPESLVNSNGLLNPVEVQFIEHNPGY